MAALGSRQIPCRLCWSAAAPERVRLKSFADPLAPKATKRVSDGREPRAPLKQFLEENQRIDGDQTGKGVEKRVIVMPVDITSAFD
jgi:hypothetical protein